MADPTTISHPATPLPASAPPTSSNPTIHLRAPKCYQKITERDAEAEWQAPSLEWLERTWTVTHSTLPMWRKAKNVRITYKILKPEHPSAATLLDDVVESEPTEKVSPFLFSMQAFGRTGLVCWEMWVRLETERGFGERKRGRMRADRRIDVDAAAETDSWG